MRALSILSILAVVSSCTKNAPSRGNEGVKLGNSAPDSGTVINNSSSKPSNQVPANHPALPSANKAPVGTIQSTFNGSYSAGSVRFLSATPLVTVFKRIDASFTESDFTPEEKVKLQEFCYHDDRDCRINMRHKTAPSLDYFKVLRSGAATACGRLLNSEITDEGNKDNLLVKENGPTVDSISSLMSRIFYGNIDIGKKVDGADKLFEAYDTYIRVTQGDKEKVKLDAYLLLCVTASTDVRSYTR